MAYVILYIKDLVVERIMFHISTEFGNKISKSTKSYFGNSNMHISKQKDKTAIQSNVFENNVHMLPKYYASIERYSNTEGHSEPSQTSEKTLFAKIGSG